MNAQGREPLHDDGGEEQTVLVLVSREPDRALLVDRLSDSVAVATDPAALNDGEDVDLVLLDAAAFREHGDRLAELRAELAPTSLPALFLSRSAETDRLPDEVWATVDDVVSLPVGTRELDARVENLLRQRELSRDLARRKERSDRRFESLFDATPDPVAVVTVDGAITTANRAFVRTFGVDPGREADANLSDVDFEPARRVERHVYRGVNDGDPDDSTVRWTATDGSTRFVELSANAVLDRGDGSERVVVFRDVTDRETHERELERQNERLEEFAGTITHDLRNPLNIARGHLELARRERDCDHLETVADAQQRMQTLIEEVLALAQQGTVVIDPAPTDLAQTAEAAWNHVETDDGALSVEVEGRVLADPGRLTSLLENVFRNAIEHGGDGTTVRVVPIDGGFGVADDGPGIDLPAHRDPFDPGVSTNDHGTGFGLAIVAQIADAHGWRVDAGESAAGGARIDLRGVEFVPASVDG